MTRNQLWKPLTGQAMEGINMSIETLSTLSIVSFIAAGVLLFAAIALFFLFDVPKLIGDISGSTARKAIEAIRQQNENTGDKAYKPSPVNIARGKVTDKISPSGNLQQRSGGLSIGAQTEKFATTELAASAAEATTILRSADETTLLDGTESGVTTILSDQASVICNEQNTQDKITATVDVEMGFSGSSELIE